MLETLLQLIVLFFVIFDPPASLAVFFTATKSMKVGERKKTAMLAVGIAALISALFLILGESVLQLFNTNINEFRVAGGIILGILGIKMVLGQSLANMNSVKKKSATAIAAVIGTPLITGPAAITSIIISTHDSGFLVTTAAVAIVLAFTASLFYYSAKNSYEVQKHETAIQVLSTILGLITLAWGVKFVTAGLGF